MKLDAAGLQSMIRAMVHEEVRTVLPGLVREHLLESYMKSSTANAAAVPSSMPKQRSPVRPPAPRRPDPSENSVKGIYSIVEYLGDATDDLADSEDDGDPEEMVPVPPPNRHDGIYNGKAPMESVPEQSVRRPHLDFIFEGTKPIPAAGSQPSPHEVPVEALEEKLGFDFSHMRQLVSGMEARRPSAAQAQLTPEEKLRHLEAKRRALDVAPPPSR